MTPPSRHAESNAIADLDAAMAGGAFLPDTTVVFSTAVQDTEWHTAVRLQWFMVFRKMNLFHAPYFGLLLITKPTRCINFSNLFLE